MRPSEQTRLATDDKFVVNPHAVDANKTRRLVITTPTSLSSFREPPACESLFGASLQEQAHRSRGRLRTWRAQPSSLPHHLCIEEESLWGLLSPSVR